MRYIDAEKLKAEIERRIEICKRVVDDERNKEDMRRYYRGKVVALEEILYPVASLPQEQIDMGEVSDGYHTFNELYYYRMLYNAAFFNLLPKGWVHKSKRHHTGEECFGGEWFIVMANLPTGQVSNHYEVKDWDLFQVPEKEIADEWDGHTPQKAADRLRKYLQQEQPSLPSDLDEAADTFNREDAARMWDYEGKTEGEIVEAAFKAGAEWMAEQGVSMQITDDTEWEEVDSFIHKNVDGCSIIQIRKK